uniref:Glycoside hydrolase family 5 domain-containing protein n=1 Tax=Kwoniella dejecticola CBS 10117 TaxID=1296121 RepID=A0A1A6A7I1_9TREE|nr:uncharacterized protein I303_03727 [Kwoniella dejecticola CBS 10117]OBR86011.1 hypothetical protein I303_03727 [Kwoniella dejecticola CBS 10117]
MVSSAPARAVLDTSHSYFLQPSGNPGDPPIALLLRGVNLGSTSKYPTLPNSLTEYSNLQGSSRSERDHKRRILAGQESHLGEEEVGLYSEAEQGGRDGWFVGRPFPIEEADVHLLRLKAWGFTTIRYLIVWEALEHGGPGKYDEEFIQYTIAILRKCREHGMRVFISPHQDVFSRFTSGSGAPYWVLVALGLNPKRIHQTGSAVVHQCWSTQGYAHVYPHPKVIWNTNLHRLAARHCFTMFWASEYFAPKCKIDGVPASEWVQNRFIAAYGHLADRLRDAGGILDDCLMGWDSMNEPQEGLIGIPDLNQCPPAQSFKKGPSPTPLQGFILGNGQAVADVEMGDFTSTGQKSKGTISITPPEGKAVWLTRQEAKQAESKWGWKWSEEWDFWDENGEGGCIWAGHGVWDPKQKSILRAQYFKPPGKGPTDFIEEFWKPHYTKFIKRIRESHSNAISFVNPPVFEEPPDLSEEVKKGRMALSSHFYDGLTLLNKREHVFNADAVGLQRGLTNMISAIRFGEKSVKSVLRGQLGELKSDANKSDGIAGQDEDRNYPTLIGEIGTPWDMKSTELFGLAKGKADRKDYKEPAKAMDQVMNACDGHNALSYTLWVYEPLSTHAHGDGWNGEDLSLISYDEIPTEGDEANDDLLILNPPDLKSLIYLGTRGIQSWCRPYPAESSAKIDKFSFDMKSGSFLLQILIPSVDDQPVLKENENEKSDDSAQPQIQGQSQEDNTNTNANANSNTGTKPNAKSDSTNVKEVQGYTKIYLPYVHYLLDSSLPPTDSEVSSRTDKERTRIIGEPSTDEEEGEWVKGNGPATVDIEVLDLSEGSLRVEGQWGWWTYTLGQKGKGERVGERQARLRIRPWRG